MLLYANRMTTVKRPGFERLRMTETQELSVPAVAPIEVMEAKVPKTILVAEFMEISGMSVRYIQPYPPPDFIKFFQQLKHKDVNFVRVPKTEDIDVLFMVDAISNLLYKLTGIHSDKINGLIKKYNTSTDAEIVQSPERTALLNIMSLAAYFADKDNIEFLREPSAH